MTMHLDKRLSTTSTKKRTVKITKAKLAELDSRWKEHNNMLKKIGLPKETFDQFLAFIYGKSVNINVEAKKTSLSDSYSLKIPEHRRTVADTVVSKETKIVGPDSCAVRSVMDPRVLANEKPEVREAILAKSRRLMPLYNKGGYQYVTDGEDVTTLGSRSRRS